MNGSEAGDPRERRDAAELAGEAIVAALSQSHGGALTAAELAARARGAGIVGEAFELALGDLERSGRVVVIAHQAPDVHLQGADLRTVGVVEDPTPVGVARARRFAEARWEGFLREFLASHRCG